LHKEIREKEGAYGAGVQNDPHKGTLSIFSYRDPNHLKSYGIYEKCVAKVVDSQFDEKDLNESKLSAF
jgi:Zn-dependent M16 (insulinase) family peptidase